MDFDDLDEAIDERIAEGDADSIGCLLSAEVAVEKREKKEFVPVAGMPLIERDHRLPLTPEVKAVLTGGKKQVTCRCFIFCGPNESALAWQEKIQKSPPWLEIAVYEWPSQGTRAEEPPTEKLEYLIDDAFDALRPAMEQLKAGTWLECAPFIFVGHSIGAQIMVDVAKKIEKKLGICPSEVIVVDRGAPEVPVLTADGMEMVKSSDDSVKMDFLKLYKKDLMAGLQGGDPGALVAATNWIKGLVVGGDETFKVGHHEFDCKLTVLRPEKNKAVDELAQHAKKFKEITLRIDGTDDKLVIPVKAKATIKDVRDGICDMFGGAGVITISSSGGSGNADSDEVGNSVTVKGLKGFVNARHTWPHPTVFIGAGYNGIKGGAHYAMKDERDFVIFDRHDIIGGDAWMDTATKHSKIQTDFAAFNPWWGMEFVKTGHGGFGRPGYYTWYKRLDLLQSFRDMASEYGLEPHVNLSTDVLEVEIVGKIDAEERYYNLHINSLKEGGKPFTSKCSVIYHFPGAYSLNRIVEYPGEETFGGQIGYGMGQRANSFVFDDGRVKGGTVAILGNGAFAVENVRSCCEFGAKKVWLVTRRKNLASPRVPCWFVHQGPIPTPADMVMKMFEPMYKLCGFGDPFDYHAVFSNKERTNVTISQSSRFGIGDVTFICHAYGRLEYKVDTVKRMSHHTLHLDGGDKLEEVTGVCKALGLIGDSRVDKVQKLTHRYGPMLNGDWRRVTQADATGMHAANFTTFSLGIGCHGFMQQWHYLYNHPEDWYAALDAGVLEYMPKHTKSPTQPDQPVYMAEVRYEMSASMIMGSYTPASGGLMEHDSLYKYILVHHLHPTDMFLQQCQEDWDYWQAKFKEQGDDHDYIPYPYNKDQIQRWMDEYSYTVKWPINVNGPEEKAKTEVMEAYENNVRKLEEYKISQVVTYSSLHKGGADDPYGAVQAAKEQGPRAKITGSSPDSAMEYDWDSYGKWSAWTSGKCKVENIDADSAGILYHEKTWEIIMERLDEVKGVFKKREGA